MSEKLKYIEDLLNEKQPDAFDLALNLDKSHSVESSANDSKTKRSTKTRNQQKQQQSQSSLPTQQQQQQAVIIDDALNYKTTKNNATTISKNAKTDLKRLINESFNYELKDIDFLFLKELFSDLPKLHEIWSRIGFNKETKTSRLETFYNQLLETIQGAVENEEDLEEKILDSIEQQRAKIKEISLELNLKLDSTKLAKSNTILEEDEKLRGELKRLEVERKKRLDEHKRLSSKEAELCNRLNLKKTELTLSVPSENDLNELAKRIRDLTDLFNQRKKEMSTLKDEIVKLCDDLEMSRSDSFAELVLFESIDMIPLSEYDIIRAKDLRDDLRHKDNEMTIEINSLKLKIKELWTKLNITNPELSKFINSSNELNEHSSTNRKSKRWLVEQLRDEHEKCIELKMENMQKFIESVRTEIKDYCKLMFISQAEMKHLQDELLNQTNYDEDLLTKHEQKLEYLKRVYETNEPMFKTTQKWMQLWSEFVQFEEKTKDPQRFKIRGYNMLEEEKQRKIFHNQLPRYEEELRNLADEYRANNDGQDFHINGIYFAEYIQRQKVDHEESKQNERREKQILRDNMKKNESRYGSKPVTPLTLRNKRKLTGQHDTQMMTPTNQARHHQSKYLKTDTNPTKLKNADITKTPGSMASVAGNNNTRVGGARVNYKPKLSVAAKRKSRTPAKRRSRLTNQMSRLDETASRQQPTDTETVSSFDTNQAEITIKTTLSSVTSSMFQSTTNLNENNSNSNSTNLSSKSTRPSSCRSSSSNTRKYPPLSNSSKFVSTGMTKTISMNRMTSTAANSFIEEECSLQTIETQQVEFNNENKQSNLKAPAAAFTKLSSKNLISKFGFQSNQTAGTKDANYLEFSRNLTKQTTQSSQLTDTTNQKSSKFVSKMTAPRNMK